MELQLGLALPNEPDARHGIDLDLNVGVDGCGPELPQPLVPEDTTMGTVPRTLPLLHWSGREDGDESMDPANRERSRVSGGASKYVKVSMDGIGIGRKVDLSLHHSFHTLKETLLHMFGVCKNHPGGTEDSNRYKLSYQDSGGHWVIPDKESCWRNFITSAHRLKILKISE